jgi:hypothetical protein
LARHHGVTGLLGRIHLPDPAVGEGVGAVKVPVAFPPVGAGDLWALPPRSPAVPLHRPLPALGDLPETDEVEPNDERPQPVTVPITVNASAARSK